MATYAPYKYVAILKWKAGEQTALGPLSSSEKAALLPIAELQDRPFDWEEDHYKKNWADHIRAVVKATVKHWGIDHEIAFDQDLTRDDELGEVSSVTIWEFLFRELWSRGVEAVPVVSSAASKDEVDALRAVSDDHARGRWVLRFVMDGNQPLPAPADVAAWFAAKVSELDAEHAEVDAVLDAGVVIGWDVASRSQRMAELMAAIAGVAPWRSLCLASGAFPENLTGIPPGAVQIQRTDWQLYLATRARPEVMELPLIYGDYGIRHVVAFDDDPRMLNKTAGLRYAHDRVWFVFKGRSVKSHGYVQYKSLCTVLISQPTVFMGATFSSGDTNYERTATDPTSTSGSSTTWIRDGMNHHVTLALSQLARLTWP